MATKRESKIKDGLAKGVKVDFEEILDGDVISLDEISGMGENGKSNLTKIIQTGFKELNLINFFTCGGDAVTGSVKVTGSGTSWTASYTVNSADTLGVVGFSAGSNILEERREGRECRWRWSRYP